MKIEIEEFIEEVKANIICYEDLGEQGALKWEKEFRKWLGNKKINKKRSVKEDKGKQYFVIKDEGEVMEVADSYYDAVEEKNEKKYWNEFR